MKQWLSLDDDEEWDANEFDLEKVYERLRDEFGKPLG